MYLKDGDIISKVAEEKHLPFLVKWGNSGGLLKYKKNKRKVNLKTQAEHLKNNSFNSDQIFVLYITGEETPVGVVEIYNVDIYNRTCSIHMYVENSEIILPKHGFTIIKLFLDYIFKRMGLFKISIDVVSDDQTLSTLLKQQDFKVEVRKRSHLFSLGSFKTVLEMAILKSEYEQRK